MTVPADFKYSDSFEHDVYEVKIAVYESELAEPGHWAGVFTIFIKGRTESAWHAAAGHHFGDYESARLAARTVAKEWIDNELRLK